MLAVAWWLLEHAPARVPSWEQALFTTVHGWPDGLRFGLWPIMQLGNFWVWPIGSLVAFAVWRRPAPAVSVALATLAAWLLAKVVKEIVLRERPAAVLTDVGLRDNAIEGYGFVSGHAAVAFALATALVPWIGRRWLVALVFVAATLVAVARLFVGAHLPLDVVGGAAIGVMCGSAAHLIVGVPARPAPDGTT